MRGDFSRDTFDPERHFSRVLMQQGRVQLDADWNEQTAILLHHLRTLARDVLGAHAGPIDALGFEIITGDTPDASLKIERFEPDPDRCRALKNAVTQAGGGNAVIAPGRYYVQGVMVESHRAILYTEQPAYGSGNVPTVESLKRWTRGLLVYLDVWERQVTALEDDRIREVALGGPDTCARAEVAWQVRVLFQPQDANVFDCNAFKRLQPHGSGRLRARARLDTPPTKLCVIPPESRYRGAENQLYRVEVHKGGLAGGTGGATFKWSRDNGSVTYPVRSVTGTMLALEHLGRDRRTSLTPGDWVELVDDATVMGEEAGPLARVELVDRDKRTVTLVLPDGVTTLPDRGPAAHPLLRRWDHAGNLGAFGGALPITEQANTDQGLQTWITLEDGLEIWFLNGGQYRSGDYWLIPARTATGDVEWPDETDTAGRIRRDADGNPVKALQGVDGPCHYYAPLLLVTAGASQERRARDCRCAIRPLPCVGYLYAYGGRVIGLDNL